MDTVLGNANLVLPDGTVHGSVAIDGTTISAVEEGKLVGATDLEGDYLLPGLIDLHTDNLEHFFTPRPGVSWPSARSAVLSHDWQMLGAGVTTVLDSLSLGDYVSGGARRAMLNAAIDGVTAARSEGLLKVDHYLHFRCELSDPELLRILDDHIDNPAVRLLSMMDHTPGQRQWHDLDLYRNFRRKKNAIVWTDDEWAAYIAERVENQRTHVPPARKRVGEIGAERRLYIASHDDTTVADVDEASADGISISEFPTTVVAAQRARELGMKIVMGSPNVVLGGSHSGNASAGELAELGLLDVLTSDYVPSSLLHAAFILADKGKPLHEAIAMVTATPAGLVGLADRGRIAPGMRADLLQVRVIDGLPVIRAIWVEGRRYM